MKTKARANARLADLEKLANATRKVQREFPSMVLYAMDVGRLQGSELPGAEMVLDEMQKKIELIRKALLPRKE